MEKTKCEFNTKNNISSEELAIFEKIKQDFPSLNENTVYLDSSSTTQKPRYVIDAVNEYYLKYCSNTGRGVYEWARAATNKVSKVRKQVADFINADESEIVFTTGATDSSNLIANSFGLKNLEDSNEILFCKEDHKSTILPWVNVVNILLNFGKKIHFKEVLIDTEGDYKEDDLASKVNNNTKVVILTHIHNVFGLEMDINLIVPRIRAVNPNCKIVLDCSQSIGHINVDMKKLDVDFAYFSGHKMFADTGIGICYVRQNNFKELFPYKVGGGMKVDDLKLDTVPNGYKMLESGTKNISGIISLGKAIDYINGIGIPLIEKYILYLTRYLYDSLKNIPNIEFEKGIDRCSCKLGFGILTFKVNGIQSSEIGEVLSDYGIYVRTGDFCKSTNNEDWIRISLHIYNSKQDIDKLIKVLMYILSEN